jgi:hypothetical protein
MGETRSKPRVPTTSQIWVKLNELAGEVEQLRHAKDKSPQWWHEHAGRFENDPVFDEIVRLGRNARKERSAKRK